VGFSTPPIGSSPAAPQAQAVARFDSSVGPRFDAAMSETFTIIPADIPLPGWLTVLRNGVPVWHAPPEKAERYARDPDYRESLRATKAHHLAPGRPCGTARRSNA
jgi:hypothetical protein